MLSVISDLKAQNSTKANLEELVSRIQPQIDINSRQNSQRSSKNVLSTSEQMIPAARIIYVLQLIKKKYDIEKNILSEIDWCIEQLAIGKIYETHLVNDSGFEHPQIAKKPDAMPWLAQFSTTNVRMEDIQAFLNQTAALTLPDSEQQIVKKNQESQKKNAKIASSLLRITSPHIM